MEKLVYFIEGNIQSISKEYCLNKYSSSIYGRFAEILTKLHTYGCNLSQNAPRNKMDSWMDSVMDKWIDA